MQCRFERRAGGWLARWSRAGLAAGALLLAGCAATGPQIDSRTYRAAGQDSRVLFLILHYTDESMADSVRILTQQNVSAHYLVSDEAPPRIYRLVDESQRAWHAGVSSWQAHALLNASSVGIEIVNPGLVKQADGSAAFAPFPPAQMAQVVALVQDIVQRHHIRPERVLAHADIAPQRRSDPGPMFPWERLAERGLVRWPEAAQVRIAREALQAAPLPDVAWFQDQLARVGYAVPRHGRLDAPTRRVLAVFQMKYRPARYDGEPDLDTAALLQALNAMPPSPPVP